MVKYDIHREAIGSAPYPLGLVYCMTAIGGFQCNCRAETLTHFTA